MKKNLLFIAISFYSILTFSQTPATALNFDGINDYVNITNQTQAFNYSSTSIFTIEFWVKPTKATTSQTIIGKGSRTAGKGYIIRIKNNQVHFRSNHTEIGDATTVIPINVWSHVAVTYNATEVKIYINGVLKKSANVDINPFLTTTAHKMFIGARRADDGNSNIRQRHFEGTLDDLRFWNVEKSASDISNSKDCTLSGNETNLVSYFKFDQGINNQNNSSQTTLINTTNTAYNGTLNAFALTGLTSNFLTSSNALSSCTLSLNSYNLENFVLYPNPSKGQITITNLKNKPLNNLLIFDVNSRLIKRFDLTNNQQQTTFDLSELNHGLYFVTISSKTNSQTLKLLIQ